MARKRLILHVGPHKTASTYLQFRLLRGRSSLAVHSFEYPEYGISQFGHHLIYSLLRGDAAAAAGVTLEDFVARLSDHSNVVLSSEDFVYLSKERLLGLKSSLPDFDIEAVLFVRTPVHLWPSHWQELVKHGGDATFLEYLGALCGWTKTFEARIMNPLIQATKFADIFGQDRIRLVCFDNIIERKEDVFDYFWRHILGIATPPPEGEYRMINPSLPLDRIDLLRNLNARYLEINGARPEEFVLKGYNKYQEAIESSGAFRKYSEVFARQAIEVHLKNDQEMFRNRERMLINRFGDRIENKAAPDKIFIRDVFERKIASGPRYWADKFGFGTFVDETLKQIVPVRNVATAISHAGL